MRATAGFEAHHTLRKRKHLSTPPLRRDSILSFKFFHVNKRKTPVTSTHIKIRANPRMKRKYKIRENYYRRAI